MTRLIDADALLKKLGNNSWNIDEWELPHEQISAGLTANAMDRETVEEMPTVDAVPVIRCKDCKHHYYHELLKQDYCEIPNMQFGEIQPNGYCHRAEREEHETD